MKNKSLAILISGSGSNFKQIHEACKSGDLPCTVDLVISDRKTAAGLAYARDEGLKTIVLRPRDFETYEAWDAALNKELLAAAVDLVILAGFLRKIAAQVLASYQGRILNIHPSLLPKYGGPNCYGLRPHQMAIKNGDKEAGATVHLVNEKYDQGEIILQKSIEIQAGESPESLQKRVLTEVEWQIYTEAIAQFIERMGGRSRNDKASTDIRI